MAKDFRETIIRINHETGEAEVWTPYPAVRRLMERTKATPVDRQINGQWWRVACRVGARAIRFGKIVIRQSSGRTEAQQAALAKAHAARQKVTGG